jgi:cell division protein FtsL
MALAHAKKDCSYRYHVSPQIKDVEQKIKKRDHVRLRRGQVFVLGCVLVGFIVGLAIVSQTARLNAKGYYLYQLQNEVQNIKTEAAVLRLEIAEMGSLARIENIAIAQLGMKKPGAGDWGILPVKQGVDLPVKMAITPVPPSENQFPLLGIVNKLLVRWLGPGRYAEASQ